MLFLQFNRNYNEARYRTYECCFSYITRLRQAEATNNPNNKYPTLMDEFFLKWLPFNSYIQSQPSLAIIEFKATALETLIRSNPLSHFHQLND